MTRTPSLLFWFGLIITASIALYHTSDRVQELNRQLHALNAQIDTEQQNIHVLNAEWAYLASPERVQAAAKKFLALRPTAAKQIVAMNDLDETLAERHHRTIAQASLAVAEAPPVASIKTSYVVPAPHVLSLPRHKSSAVATAATDTEHVNDHVTIRRTASVQTQDSIGSLITQLDEQP